MPASGSCNARSAGVQPKARGRARRAQLPAAHADPVDITRLPKLRCEAFQRAGGRDEMQLALAPVLADTS